MSLPNDEIGVNCDTDVTGAAVLTVFPAVGAGRVMVTVPRNGFVGVPAAVNVTTG